MRKVAFNATLRRSISGRTTSLFVSSLTAVASRRGLEQRPMNDVYYQEAYEALQRTRSSATYPGPIRAACPGPSKHSTNTLFDAGPLGQRPYWRAVVDDPQLPESVQIRVRFKERVFVAPGFETHQHVILVRVPPSATVSEVCDAARATNVSTQIAIDLFDLSLDGQALDSEDTVESIVQRHIATGRANADIMEGSARSSSSNQQQQQRHQLDGAARIALFDRGLTLDAIDPAEDHLWHTPEVTPKNWDEHDVATEVASELPHADLTMLAEYNSKEDTVEGEAAASAAGNVLHFPSKPSVDFGHVR